MNIYFGEQTKQALQNFPFPLPNVDLDFIYAIVEVKKAAAIANKRAGSLDSVRFSAITKACNCILQGNYDSQFVTPALQGGAGTSINMNCNEVIATLANEFLKNRKEKVHANDHVNMSQSTNDVNPSALRICLYRLCNQLIKELEKLSVTLKKKARIYKKVSKLGRTHMQDAVPTTLGAELLAYKAVVDRDSKRLKQIQTLLVELNLGGTAIGNAINASKEYRKHVYQQLSFITGIKVKPLANLMAGTSCGGDFCELSGVITLIAINLSKIATDIRFMASGPKGGIGEITLEPLQPGSSIMPGKVNPVIPESINQISFFIQGKNHTVHLAVENASLELAVMFPVLSESLISSLKLLTAGVKVFNENCFTSLKANEINCRQHLEQSMAYATLLTPQLGYDVVSNAVKKAIASNKSLREVIVEDSLVSEKEFNSFLQLYE